MLFYYELQITCVVDFSFIFFCFCVFGSESYSTFTFTLACGSESLAAIL